MYTSKASKKRLKTSVIEGGFDQLDLRLEQEYLDQC